ncbi:hypothetical protein AAC387_Pa02g4334 [Persea americana]
MESSSSTAVFFRVALRHASVGYFPHCSCYNSLASSLLTLFSSGMRSMVLARFDVIFSSRMRSMALPCGVSRVSLDSLLLKA